MSNTRIKLLDLSFFGDGRPCSPSYLFTFYEEYQLENCRTLSPLKEYV